MRSGQLMVWGEKASGASVLPVPSQAAGPSVGLSKGNSLPFEGKMERGDWGTEGLSNANSERVIGVTPSHDLRQEPAPLHAAVCAFTLLEQGTVTWFWHRPNNLNIKRAQRKCRNYQKPGMIPNGQFGCSVWAALCHLVLRPVSLDNAAVAPVTKARKGDSTNSPWFVVVVGVQWPPSQPIHSSFWSSSKQTHPMRPHG